MGVFLSTWKTLEKTWEIDNNSRISKEAEMKKKSIEIISA